MQHDDLVRAVTTAVAYASMLAGHYVGDQWLQTSAQACKKSLAGAASPGAASPGTALWHCAKHVAAWTATTTGFFLGAAWWLHLPIHWGWLAAGVAVNAVTHYVADLRTPLLWLAGLAGKSGYIEHANVQRPSGADRFGPGTATFHLDQSWHIAWLLPAALLVAGCA